MDSMEDNHSLWLFLSLSSASIPDIIDRQNKNILNDWHHRHFYHQHRHRRWRNTVYHNKFAAIVVVNNNMISKKKWLASSLSLLSNTPKYPRSIVICRRRRLE